MEQPNLGKQISEIRKANGLTQEELAEKCKISVRTLQRIEAGVVRPRAYTVKVIFAALKEENPFMRLQFEHIKNLFNFKINTMKKVSILSAAILATGLGLFALTTESKAQADFSKKYVKDNSRGIVILRPRGLLGYGQYYRNDTLFLHAGKDLIKECNGHVYLNDVFAGCANDGDTVILNKATFLKKTKLEFRQVEYQSIPGYRDASFIFPKHLSLRMAHNDKMYYWVENHEIAEKDDKIFLNGVYQGEAFAKDTVILSPRGNLTIKNSNRIIN